MNNLPGAAPPGIFRNTIAGVPSCVPLVRPPGDAGPEIAAPALPGQKRPNHRNLARREAAITRDTLFTVRQDDAYHIVSENYAYKTESYYLILRHELEGRNVRPSSAAVLDACVVPICLERAHLAGIPVCEWGISQGYAPLPSVVYGLNYFATTADHTVIHDHESAKEVIKHITNKGKYPFCYQKLETGAEIGSCTSIFGKTAGACREAADIARAVYGLFEVPLVTIVYVKCGERYLLSSLSPTRYSGLSADERTLLSAHLSHQEFL
ncbi:MAG: RimK-like ATPgrasp N-terminal domain-containing protein [Methanoregula sp.]|uniref:RimK-like ATPgrasp N-terminal domain-containing protein n=1 Tax=Methanoregula sp. TaxID=2052170 RepID=UPI0025F6A442|nr:RimK-like ATPgrasp N-terminal domain-containing protein [Methanoregula sp.]MCK9632690.1 RimK-like ATPgrasp N-terminal domain-containing protein [Methanoregula sp.]